MEIKFSKQFYVDRILESTDVHKPYQLKTMKKEVVIEVYNKVISLEKHVKYMIEQYESEIEKLRKKLETETKLSPLTNGSSISE